MVAYLKKQGYSAYMIAKDDLIKKEIDSIVKQ